MGPFRTTNGLKMALVVNSDLKFDIYGQIYTKYYYYTKYFPNITE